MMSLRETINERPSTYLPTSATMSTYTESPLSPEVLSEAGDLVVVVRKLKTDFIAITDDLAVFDKERFETGRPTDKFLALSPTWIKHRDVSLT